LERAARLFRELRSEIEQLREQLALERELQRRQTLQEVGWLQRLTDRVAALEPRSEIEQLREQLAELREQLADLQRRQTFAEVAMLARLTNRVAALELQATGRAGPAPYEEPTPPASPQEDWRGPDR